MYTYTCIHMAAREELIDYFVSCRERLHHIDSCLNDNDNIIITTTTTTTATAAATTATATTATTTTTNNDY